MRLQDRPVRRTNQIDRAKSDLFHRYAKIG